MSSKNEAKNQESYRYWTQRRRRQWEWPKRSSGRGRERALSWNSEAKLASKREPFWPRTRSFWDHSCPFALPQRNHLAVFSKSCWLCRRRICTASNEPAVLRFRLRLSSSSLGLYLSGPSLRAASLSATQFSLPLNNNNKKKTKKIKSDRFFYSPSLLHEEDEFVIITSLFLSFFEFSVGWFIAKIMRYLNSREAYLNTSRSRRRIAKDLVGTGGAGQATCRMLVENDVVLVFSVKITGRSNSILYFVRHQNESWPYK